MYTAVLRDVIISDTNRRRLGTLLDRARRSGYERRDVVDYLEEKLEMAECVAANKLPDDVITVNSRFSVRDLDTHEMEECCLVYPELADAERKLLSVLSGMGAALLGCHVGDEVNIRTAAGMRRIGIEAVLY